MIVWASGSNDTFRILLHFSIALMCPVLGNPANGRVSVTGNSPGDTATYTCDVGYNLVGAQNLTCGGDGMWASPPFCQGAVGMKTVLHAYLDNLLMYIGIP